MTLSQPQSKPQSDPIMADLSRALDAELRGLRQAAATPPPAVPEGRGRAANWGPSHPHALSPLSLLLQVANNAHLLQQQVADFAQSLTGDVPAIHSRSPQKLPASLLPAVAHLADEIERVHASISQSIEALRARL